MKGKLKYFEKCEDTPNSIEGWSVIPILNQFSSISYNLNQKSLDIISNYDKSKTHDIEYKLLTNCRIDENGYHSHHGVIAEIEI